MRAIYSNVAGNEVIEVFEKIREILMGYNIKSVSEISGVSEPTLYFWLDGTTQKPRLDTISKVADALGFRLQLTLVGNTRARKSYLRVVK